MLCPGVVGACCVTFPAEQRRIDTCTEIVLVVQSEVCRATCLHHERKVAIGISPQLHALRHFWHSRGSGHALSSKFLLPVAKCSREQA